MEQKKKQQNKQEIIEKLNGNYRMILSYGDKTLMPISEFIVKDIISDEIPEEYSDIISERETARVILVNISNEEELIEMPLNVFISKCLEIATKNAETLETDVNLVRSKTIVEELQSLLAHEDNLQNYEDKLPEYLSLITYTSKEATSNTVLVSLEECNAQYSNNNSECGNNYSIYPLNINWFKVIGEKIKLPEDDKELSR